MYACFNLKTNKRFIIIIIENHYILFLVQYQGWDLAHLISERIARFLSKNERMSALVKKLSDSLICSFLVSKMSDSLKSLISSEQPEQIPHGCSVLVSKMSDALTLLTWFERNELFTHIAYQKRENERK